MSFDSKDAGSALISISGHCYQKTVDWRNERFDKDGNPDDYGKLSTGRIVAAEFLFVPCMVLSSIETIVRGALYLLLTPLSIALFALVNEDSIKEGAQIGVLLPLFFAGLQASIVSASAKALYRNIFSDALPGIQDTITDKRYLGKDRDSSLSYAAIDFTITELTCGF
jgi:hypothetical protein